MQEAIKGYNVLVGALDVAIQKGTFDLSEIRQIIIAMDSLSKHLTQAATPSVDPDVK